VIGVVPKISRDLRWIFNPSIKFSQSSIFPVFKNRSLNELVGLKFKHTKTQPSYIGNLYVQQLLVVYSMTPKQLLFDVITHVLL